MPLYLWPGVQLTACDAGTALATARERLRQLYRHGMGARTIGYVLARQMRGAPPWHGAVLWRLLMAHVVLPVTLLATSLGVPWWHVWNRAADVAAADPIAASALRVLAAASVLTAAGFVGVLANFAVLKYIYLGQGPALADVAALATLPIAAPLYMYLPILCAQTTLFFREAIRYHVTPKPAVAAV